MSTYTIRTHHCADHLRKLGPLVIVVAGHLNAAAAMELSAIARELYGHCCFRVAIDLSGCSPICSLAWAALIEIADAATEYKGKLALCGLAGVNLRAAQIIGISQIAALCDTLEAGKVLVTETQEVPHE